MKINSLLRVAVSIIVMGIQAMVTYAQAPQKMTFQSVIRNSSGALVVSSTVGMQMSILLDSATGPALYVERQFPVTNANGLATIFIGDGTVISGSFDSINWASGSYYLKAETDPTGGTSYTITATKQLVSVPYAFYATHSGDTTHGTRPTVVTDSATAVSFTTTTLYGDITSYGGDLIIYRGFCVDTVPMPDLGASYVIPGSNTGSYHVNVTGLLPNKLYHARAFANNTNGPAFGDTLSFTTLALTTPTVLTDSIAGISNVSANGIGTVTSDGGSPVTARGICWNTTGMPTTADATSPSGTGTGSFLTTLSSLIPSTHYYARAYATNALGTSYGAEDSFVTIVLSYATISTDTITGIYAHSAVSGITVSSTGGSSISAQGICWGRGTLPTTDSPIYYTTTGLGDYPVSIFSLLPSTTYYVRAFCTNSTGTVYGASRTFTTPALAVPVLTTNSIIGITAVSATSGGNISSDGGSAITARGVCRSVSGTPTIDSSHTTDGTGTGFYNSNMTGLSPLTTYYIRAYATNSIGTAYGSLISFTTDSLVTILPSLPVVGTNVPAMVTSSTGSCGGYVLNAGGSTVTAYGICWGTSTAPTLSGSHTVDGSGLGYFSSVMTGLSGCGTLYYVRAYATNSLGTAYGNEYILSTGLPLTLTDTTVTSITPTTAVAHGNVTSDGGCTITRRGFVWAIAFDTSFVAGPPTLGDGYSSSDTIGTGTGSFTATLSGLHSNLTYNLRAYATNSIGTLYGPLQTFLTTTPTTLYLGEYYAGGYIFI